MKIYIIILITLLFYSCNEFLDLKPHGKIIPKTADEFSAILHSHLSKIDLGDEKYLIGNYNNIVRLDYITDNIDNSIKQSKTETFIGAKIERGEYDNIYRYMYQYIRNCNIIIEKITNKDKGTEIGKKTLATAYAMRAAAYLHLVKNFSEAYSKDNAENQLGVPLVTKFDIEKKPLRAPINEVRNLIYADLKKSIEFDIKDKDYIFYNDVAKVYLMRAYFWFEEWDKLIPLGTELIAKYPLLNGDAYLNMMNSIYEKKGNIILKSFNIPGTSISTFDAAQVNSKRSPYSKELVSLFLEKEMDIRFKNFIGNEKNNFRGNLKVLNSKIRSAEYCLMLAEAYAHTNQATLALEQLNNLRSNRIAPYTAYTLATLPEVDKSYLIKVDAQGNPLSKLMYAILTERQKEFIMEGDRWFELKRNGCPEFWKAKDGQKLETKKIYYTYPIPLREFVFRPELKQNPGYIKL